MNINSFFAIVVLALVGTGLGIVGAQWMAPQSPVENTVLYSAEAHGNDTVVSIFAARSYGFDGGIEIKPRREPTQEERQKAIDIALFDSKVKDILDGKEYEIDYVECLPSMSGQDTHASVVFIPDASEDDSCLILVLVNMDEKTVVEVMTIVGDPRKPTQEERQKAISIVLSNSKIKDILDGKEYEIDYVECLPSMSGHDMYASLEILIPDPSEDNTYLLLVLVNMDKKTVVEVIMDGYSSLPEPEPLTPKEEKQVTDIALLDPTVKELLKGRAYNVSEVFVYAMPENERWAEVLIYIPDMSAKMSAYMIVGINLNESTMEYLSFEMIQEDDLWLMSIDGATGVNSSANMVSAEL